FPYASYYQALDPTTLKPGFFKGSMVLVGRHVKPSPEPEARQADLFTTPMSAWQAQQTPGVEIQAQKLATVLDHRIVREVPEALALALMAVIAVVTLWLMRSWEPLRSGIRCLGVAAGVVVAALVLFRYLDRWLPMAALLVGLAMAYVGEGGRAFLHERERRRRTREAFTRYLSPHLVEELVAHPEKLKLGGERRVLTIL